MTRILEGSSFRSSVASLAVDCEGHITRFEYLISEVWNLSAIKSRKSFPLLAVIRCLLSHGTNEIRSHRVNMQGLRTVTPSPRFALKKCSTGRPFCFGKLQKRRRCRANLKNARLLLSSLLPNRFNI